MRNHPTPKKSKKIVARAYILAFFRNFAATFRESEPSGQKSERFGQ